MAVLSHRFGAKTHCSADPSDPFKSHSDNPFLKILLEKDAPKESMNFLTPRK